MTVIQQAEERLRRLILDMEIGPGERLTERWLEGQTGASRSSIRTALVRLEAEGLVAREGRGWLVPPIDLQEIEQLFVYREMLEVTAVRLGGKEAEESYLREGEAILDAVPINASAEETESAGRQFHLWIAGLARNEFISRGARRGPDAPPACQMVGEPTGTSRLGRASRHHRRLEGMRYRTRRGDGRIARPGDKGPVAGNSPKRPAQSQGTRNHHSS